MNDEQIQALAREYAEECAEEVGVMFNPQNWACSKCEIEAKAVIIWLLRRFYLADKEKAKAFYRGETFGELDFIELTSSRRILSSLFPEIAKEAKQ